MLNTLGGLIQGMTLADRIREVMDASGKSNADIAKASGKTPGAVSQWLNGMTKTLKADSAMLLERETGFRAEWIATGKGPKLAKEPSNVEPLMAPMIPVLTWVQAGDFTSTGSFRPSDAEEWIPCPMPHGPRTYALTIRGNSMYNPGGERTFAEGDKVFVDPDREPRNKSLVVVMLDDEKEATFKQLLIEGSRKFLQALNPNWPHKIFEVNGNASCCGVVIGKLEIFA